MRRVVACAAWLAATTGSASADDADAFLNLGAIGSFSAGNHSMIGIGLEATYTRIANTTGLGGYLQGEIGTAGGDRDPFDMRRYAAGFHSLRGFFGVEVGGLYRTKPGLDGAFGLQFGVFATLGIVSAEVRVGLSPIGTSRDPRYGSDLGLVLSSKFPLQVRGKATTVKNQQILPCIWACVRPR